MPAHGNPRGSSNEASHRHATTAPTTAGTHLPRKHRLNAAPHRHADHHLLLGGQLDLGSLRNAPQAGQQLGALRRGSCAEAEQGSRQKGVERGNNITSRRRQALSRHATPRHTAPHRAIDAGGLELRVDEPLHDGAVPVVAPQVGIPARRQHLDHAAAHLSGGWGGRGGRGGEDFYQRAAAAVTLAAAEAAAWGQGGWGASVADRAAQSRASAAPRAATRQRCRPPGQTPAPSGPRRRPRRRPAPPPRAPCTAAHAAGRHVSRTMAGQRAVAGPRPVSFWTSLVPHPSTT